jgi:hypothetical protein
VYIHLIVSDEVFSPYLSDPVSRLILLLHFSVALFMIFNRLIFFSFLHYFSNSPGLLTCQYRSPLLVHPLFAFTFLWHGYASGLLVLDFFMDLLMGFSFLAFTSLCISLTQIWISRIHLWGFVWIWQWWFTSILLLVMKFFCRFVRSSHRLLFLLHFSRLISGFQ